LSCLGYSAFDARYEALVHVKMGLVKPALRFIAREHRRKPFTGPILTLGRQDLLPTMDAIRALLTSEGITPTSARAGTDVASGIGARDNTEPRDVAFFKLLGVIEVLVLDYSPTRVRKLSTILTVPPRSNYTIALT
jgi:hypothetical protein